MRTHAHTHFVSANRLFAVLDYLQQQGQDAEIFDKGAICYFLSQGMTTQQVVAVLLNQKES